MLNEILDAKNNQNTLTGTLLQRRADPGDHVGTTCVG